MLTEKKQNLQIKLTSLNQKIDRKNKQKRQEIKQKVFRKITSWSENV